MLTLREKFDAGEICIDKMTPELFDWLKENGYRFKNHKPLKSFWLDKERICYEKFVLWGASPSRKNVTAEEFMKEVKGVKYGDIKEGEKFTMSGSRYIKKNGLPWHIRIDDWSFEGIGTFDINPIVLYVEKTEAEIELGKLGQQIEELTKQYETASLAVMQSKGEKS